MKRYSSKGTIIISFLFIVFISQLQVLSSCANIIPPAGGPRDSIPPVLVRASPPDSALRFSGDRITLEFDEYVDVQNLQENLIISPTPLIAPTIESRFETVTIRLRDTLEPNTTYTFNFGRAIRDVNEGNVLPGFRYIFSTGSSIDSFRLSGNVILAESGKLDTTLIVMLHRSADDSAVVRDRPRYVTRVDGRGNFRFEHLPAGTFYLYALKDQGGSRRLMGRDQLFAFASNPVTVGPGTEAITLYAYAEKGGGRGAATTGIRPPVRTGNAQDRRLRFTASAGTTDQDLLGTLSLNFEEPLANYDSSLISLYSDTGFLAREAFTTKIDSTEKKIELMVNWKENRVYNLVLDKDFAEDTAGRKLLKTDTIMFLTKKLTDYGSVSIRLKNLDLTRNPVLQFVQNDAVMRAFPLSGETFSQQLFLPGEYELRILFDRNGNGKWDPGDFFGGRLQPELVTPIERTVIVKPNWQNEFEIRL